MNREFELRISPTGNNDAQRDSDLVTNEDLLQIVEAAVYAGIHRICWAGGEPLDRPGFAELVRACRDHGIREQRITTDGLQYADQADALKAAGIDQVDINANTLNTHTL